MKVLEVLQCPLSNGYGDEARFAKAVLYGSLEGVCTAHFRIENDESYGPVHHDGEDDEESDAGQQARLAESIRLSYNSSTTCTQSAQHLSMHRKSSYIMLLAMFINAFRRPLFGLALSRRSSALKPMSALATVMLGASISVNNGNL